MENLTTKEYNGFISKGKVVIDFWAEWCGPCKMLGPILEEISKELKDIKFGKLNVDDNEDIASNAEIRGIPTLVLYKDGKEVDRIVGFLPKDTLKHRIEKGLK
jgi:thioredoxin 1